MTTLLNISILLATGFSFWRIGRRLRFSLHMIQLFGYKTEPYGNWISERKRDLLYRVSHSLGLLILALILLLKPDSIVFLTLVYTLWAAAFASSKRYRRDRPKKPLAWTARLKRLAALSALLTAASVVIGSTLALTAAGHAQAIFLLSGFWIADFAAPLFVRLAAFLISGNEARIHNGFKTAARDRLLERHDLEVVAITGSYGKTSVKYAVSEVLNQRYPTLMTPGSFNTPMGISKVINKDLSDDHRYLVLEMGMRHAGDIAELTDIASPDLAIITSIGPAHLESMGSVEAIAQEKLSLLDALSEDGVAVVNGDDPLVLDGALEHQVDLFVVSVERNGVDLWASDINYGAEGASFSVHSATGQQVDFTTRLLGKHNISNILLALGAGLNAGLTLRQMRLAVERLDSVPHRLALRNEGGLIILDDAFNSNPVGAGNAVEVLGQFSSGNRVIVTPGMIELGAEEEKLNKAFGKQIAKHADIALLVGPERTLPIAEGLTGSGWEGERIVVCATLFEAKDWIAANLKSGDVVLFENDLPDQFTENVPAT